MNIDRIKIKNITSTIRENSGYTPAVGELVFENDTGKLYVGNGTTKISNLNTIPAIPPTVDTSLKCCMYFEETPLFGENNICLKDNAGNFDFRRINEVGNSELITNDKKSDGSYCIHSDKDTWIKAPANGNLLNLNPANNYMFDFAIRINSTQNTWNSFYEYGGHTYLIRDLGGDGEKQNFIDKFTRYASMDNHPASIHSQEQLDFIVDTVISNDGWQSSWGAKYASPGGLVEKNGDNYTITWMDGSPDDFQNIKDDGWYVKLNTDSDHMMKAEYSGDLNSHRLFEWDYIIRRKSILSLGSLLFFRYENDKLKLEIPSWNIDETGSNSLSKDEWININLKIFNGKIYAYYNGQEEISADIPAGASTLTPDFISLGGFTGYFSKFLYLSEAN